MNIDGALVLWGVIFLSIALAVWPERKQSDWDRLIAILSEIRKQVNK